MTSTAQVSENCVADAQAAKQERLVALMGRVHLVLLAVTGPVVLGVYGLHLFLAPSWQYGAILAAAVTCVFSWVGSYRLCRRGAVQAAAAVIYGSVWLLCAVALLLREGSLAMAVMALVAASIVVWMGWPGFLVRSSVISVATLVTARVLEHFHLLPTVHVPPTLAVIFDVGLTAAVFPAFVGFLRVGSQANEVPFERLGATFAMITRVQPTLSRLAVSVRKGADVVAVSASQQASTSEQVVAATRELEQSLLKTSAATTEARSIADATRETSGVAMESLRQVAEHMDRFQQTVEQVVKTSGELSQKSERTEDVIKMIEEVHTRLMILSVNASIEASRGGESARGISIVSQEMRELIKGTETGLRTGRDLLAAIRREAAASARSSSEASEELRRHVGALRAAGESMRGIVESFAETSETIATIADSSAEQRDQIESVKAAMDDLSGAAAALTRAADEMVENAKQWAAGQKDLEEAVGVRSDAEVVTAAAPDRRAPAAKVAA